MMTVKELIENIGSHNIPDPLLSNMRRHEDAELSGVAVELFMRSMDMTKLIEAAADKALNALVELAQVVHAARTGQQPNEVAKDSPEVHAVMSEFLKRGEALAKDSPAGFEYAVEYHEEPEDPDHAAPDHAAQVAKLEDLFRRSPGN